MELTVYIMLEQITIVFNINQYYLVHSQLQSTIVIKT